VLLRCLEHWSDRGLRAAVILVVNVNRFDVAVLTFVNQFVGRWPEFDRFIAYLTWQNTLKGGVLCTLLWWAWFSGRDRAREIVLSTISGSFAAVLTARLLVAELPMRVRPLANPALNLRIPRGINAGQFIAWSSFPSDHAVLFIGLATGLCFVLARVGIAALVYTVLVILFPRLYGAIHYPTDLIAGALLGAAFVLLACWRPIRDRLSRPLLAFEKRRPAIFYAALFVTCFEIGELFTGVLNSARSVMRLMARLLH